MISVQFYCSVYSEGISEKKLVINIFCFCFYFWLFCFQLIVFGKKISGMLKVHDKIETVSLISQIKQMG